MTGEKEVAWYKNHESMQRAQSCVKSSEKTTLKKKVQVSLCLEKPLYFKHKREKTSDSEFHVDH